MAGPWEEYASPQPTAPQGPWSEFSQEQAPAPGKKMVPLSVLPFSVSEDGNDFKFDSNAGVLGAVKRSFMLPGDVATGKVDPMSPEGRARALEMAATFSPMPAATRAGEGGMVALRQAQPEVPTTNALRTAAKEGYDTARSLGVDYSPKHVSGLAGSIAQDLNGAGFVPKNAPTAHGLLDDLATPPVAGPGETVLTPFDNLHAARKAFRILSQERKDGQLTPNAAAASRALGKIDQFLENPPEGAVLRGPGQEAGQILKDANGNYAAASRSDTLNGIDDAAELRAAAANSGKNIGNSVRSRVASLLLNPKKLSGFSPEEIDALRGVTEGTATRNVMRDVGNLFGGGGGLGAVVSGGVAGAGAASATHNPLVGGLIGFGVPAVGFAAKAGENALTRRALGAADEMVRSRSPLARELQNNAPMIEQYPIARQALVRALMDMGLTPKPQQ